MPVRSLNSSVLRWVPKEEVVKAFKDWANKVCLNRRDVVRIGFFGSYARGDWGVGSDLDVILVLKESDLPFWKRCVEFDTTDLPVPVDLLVYTVGELEKMKDSRFYKDVIERETVWVGCNRKR